MNMNMDQNLLLIKDEKGDELAPVVHKKRGKYNKITEPVRKIILNLAKHSIPICTISEICELSPQTVRSILRIGPCPKRRGGFRHSKMTEELVVLIQELISDRGNMSLKEIQQYLNDRMKKVISITTLNRKIPDFLYVNSPKSTNKEDVNSPENIQKRHQFALRYEALLSTHHLLYITDINFHIWSTLHKRSRVKDELQKLKKYSQKGSGIHIVVAMSSIFGMLFYETYETSLQPTYFPSFMDRIQKELAEKEQPNPQYLILDDTTLNRGHLILDTCNKFNVPILFFPSAVGTQTPIDITLDMFKRNTILRFQQIKSLMPHNTEDPNGTAQLENRIQLLYEIIREEYHKITIVDCKKSMERFNEILRKYRNKEYIENETLI